MSDPTQHTDGQSLDLKAQKLAQLKAIFPEAFSEGKVDWEKLKATLGANINLSNERYVLNWAGKSDAFKALQTPSTRTLVPSREESVNFDSTENLFIEGENLEVLKVLQKSYFGQVKMIYIDPPYNTGSDSFIYPDKFSETKAEYQQRVGDVDEEGYMTKEGLFRKNSKENGQYHSNWMNMMYPRLFLAKNLLKDEGVIFVSIDDNEVHNLRMLMNEVFGEENLIGQFVWRTDGNFDNQAKIKNCHEYILLYGKFQEKFDPPPIIDPNIPRDSKLYNQVIRNTLVKNGPKNPVSEVTLPIGFPADFDNGKINKTDKSWPNYLDDVLVENGRLKNEVVVKSGWSSKDLLNSFIENNCSPIEDSKKQKTSFVVAKSGAIEVIKERSDKQSHVISVLSNFGGSQKASSELEKLNVIFDDYPKPTVLLKYLISMINEEAPIILDFFAGSATTPHSVMELNRSDGLNRKFIAVQLAEPCKEFTKAFKAGYRTIADVSKERIRRVGKKIEGEIGTEVAALQGKIKKLEGELSTSETQQQIENLKSKIKSLQAQDLGFKVLKLSDSNFKQWRQIQGKDAKALAEQMHVFIDPVSPEATVDNMVFELMLKNGKDLNSKVVQKEGYHCINGNELVLMLEEATQTIVDAIVAEEPEKVIALDKLFEGNDQLKTNTALQLKDAGIAFKTI